MPWMANANAAQNRQWWRRWLRRSLATGRLDSWYSPCQYSSAYPHRRGSSQLVPRGSVRIRLHLGTTDRGRIVVAFQPGGKSLRWCRVDSTVQRVLAVTWLSSGGHSSDTIECSQSHRHNVSRSELVLMRVFCSLPVPISLTVTLTVPLASISNVISIYGTPRGASRMPSKWIRPSVRLSRAIGRSPCNTCTSTLD